MAEKRYKAVRVNVRRQQGEKRFLFLWWQDDSRQGDKRLLQGEESMCFGGYIKDVIYISNVLRF